MNVVGRYQRMETVLFKSRGFLTWFSESILIRICCSKCYLFSCSKNIHSILNTVLDTRDTPIPNKKLTWEEFILEQANGTRVTEVRITPDRELLQKGKQSQAEGANPAGSSSFSLSLSLSFPPFHPSFSLPTHRHTHRDTPERERTQSEIERLWSEMTYTFSPLSPVTLFILWFHWRLFCLCWILPGNGKPIRRLVLTWKKEQFLEVLDIRERLKVRKRQLEDWEV